MATLCVSAWGIHTATGTIITFQASIEYTGGSPPQGPTPWLTATFDDQDTPGSVTLTLTATNLIEQESLKIWVFNLDPALDPCALTFSPPTTEAGTFTDPTISHSANAYKADGDGFFDIKFAFDITDGASKKFGPGDSVSYAVGGIAGLTAGSFDFISAPDGAGRGIYPTAAHVLGIGPGGADSGWVTVPEPATLGLLGLSGVALIRRPGRRDQ